MRRKLLWCTAVLLLAMLLAGCGGMKLSSPEKAAWRQCSRVLPQIKGALSASGFDPPTKKGEQATLVPEDRARVEAAAAKAGFCILRSGRDIPEYLADSEELLHFLDRVRQGMDCNFPLFQITEEGKLSCRYFWQEHGAFCLTTLTCDPEGSGKSAIVMHETYRVQDWSVSENGNFFYQIFWEDDQHFANYCRIRLKEPDKALWRLTRECIQPIGYSGTNLFLVNWAAPDYGKLCPNDLWDFVYFAQSGALPDTEGLPFDLKRQCYWIPAARFEELILPKFPMSREELRGVADYDAERDCYAWIPLESELMIRYGHPLVEPEVTACHQNEDGSLTVTVETVCTDRKLDDLYSHQVTVREQPDGTWQYLGNKTLTQPKDFVTISRREMLDSIV